MEAVNISRPATANIGEGWRENDWDKLLINIEAGTVIPVIGRDLLYVSPNADTPPVLLYNYIAARLLEVSDLRKKYAGTKVTEEYAPVWNRFLAKEGQ
jgi:hypothetical protein